MAHGRTDRRVLTELLDEFVGESDPISLDTELA